ncbi:MAG TPA: GrpB family protein [bacterium]|nr:GrpB family protein [bacterium]
MPVIGIVEYDPRWPALFEEEKARLLSAAGPLLAAIEHIGSTAVPRLAANPIIDIMGGVRDLGEVTRYVAVLEGLGYEYVPQYEAFIPERRYFRKPTRGHSPRTHHLHVVELTSDFWRRHLLFRDYLRTHPQALREYADLKRHLASEYGDDGRGYTDAKGAFHRIDSGSSGRGRAGSGFGTAGTSIWRFIV